MQVSVIVPARDAAPTLPALLDALAAQTLPRGAFEVLLADDGSTDATRAIADAHPVGVTVLDAGGAAGPAGPGAARNAGAAAAQGEILAFTDADCAPRPDWLEAGLRAMRNADLVQGAVVADPSADRGPFDRTVEVGLFTGLFETANMLVRRATFDAAGGFEPWLHPERSKELAEDVWLGWRVRRSGARVVFAPDAVVEHAVFGRDAPAYVAERLRLRYFPEIVARVPELRDTLLTHRVFMSRRTAAFDLALAGAVAALATRRAAPLAAAGPYAAQLLAHARPWGVRRAPLVAVAELAADAVGCAALLTGSLRARSLVV